MRPRRRVSVMVVAVLAALVAFLQLPGPATCPNLSWRWVALALEALDADPPAELTDETVADAAAVAKVKAAEAAELHAKGKHAEAEQAAKDGLKLLGM